MKLKNFLAVLLIIMSFTACDEDTSDQNKEDNVEFSFYYGNTEITDLNSTINLNGNGTLTYILDEASSDAVRVTAKLIGVSSGEVTVNYENNKGSIVIASIIKDPAILEITLTNKNNNKIIRTFQLKITNFTNEEPKKKPTVSLNAQVNDEGMHNVYIRYRSDNMVSLYALPVIANGLDDSEQQLDVKIAVDNDTLAKLNAEKYNTTNYLYYKQLPETYYSFSPTCHIQEGTNTQTHTIDLKNFSGLDMSEKWVLPLTIEKDPSYTLNSTNGQHKALLRVMPFNDYSGVYSGDLCNIYIKPNINDVITKKENQAYVVDEKTIFLYAGVIDDTRNDCKKYKVFVRFTDKSIDSQKNKVEIWSDNADNDLKIEEQPYYTWREEMDVTNAHLKHIYITLYVAYTFKDYTVIPSYPIEYTVKGTLTMQRTLNTLIPDEDQAIIW